MMSDDLFKLLRAQQMAAIQTENYSNNPIRRDDNSKTDVSPSASQARCDMKINLANVSMFMAELRDLGLEANYLIRRAIGEEDAGKKQYLIAMLVSPEEILNKDYTGIEEFRRYLLNSNDSKSFHAERRYVLKDRIVVLLNSPWPRKHGEARLLDPCCKILPDIVESCNCSSSTDFLSLMEEKFDRILGPVRRILLLFSYYIPCTLPEHHCAKLIREFAVRNNETIIVSYQSVYQNTAPSDAYDFMESDNNNVTVLPRKFLNIVIKKQIKQKFLSVELHDKEDENIRYEDSDALKKTERRKKKRNKSAKQPKIEHIGRKNKLNKRQEYRNESDLFRCFQKQTYSHWW